MAGEGRGVNDFHNESHCSIHTGAALDSIGPKGDYLVV